MQIDKGVLPASVDVGELVESDPTALGLVVLDRDGRVVSANGRAKELLAADALPLIAERLQSLPLADSPNRDDEWPGQASLEGSGLTPVVVLKYHVGEHDVLLLRAHATSSVNDQVLQQASRSRVFTFFARDWAHDLKGMLHVIRINSALLGRLLQRDSSTNAAVTRCLDAIPREVEHLDRSIELLFSAAATDRARRFDVGAMCQRVMQLIKARAARHRVEIGLETSGGAHEIIGFEDQLQAALMNLAVNALEAMPQEGRLLIHLSGSENEVTIRISDTGSGLQPELLSRRRLQLVTGVDRVGIGLLVTRAIVDAHGGRLTSVSNVPQGTCIEITLPTTASTERLVHGSRTHR